MDMLQPLAWPINPSCGSSFATEEGPWPRYVKHLAERGDLEAKSLLTFYKDSVWDFLQQWDLACEVSTPDLPCARILEIDSDDNVRALSTLTFGELHDHCKQAVEGDRFLDALRSSGSNLSSRLLTWNNDCFNFEPNPMQGETFSEHGLKVMTFFAAQQNLLLGHILGIEYDMNFTEVHHRLNLKMQKFCGLGHLCTNEDMVFFSPTTARYHVEASQMIRAYTIGLRKVGGREIEHCKHTCSNSPCIKWSF